MKMEISPTLPKQKREVFILRLWQKSPQGVWIAEIQNVKTGQVVHLSDLGAIGDYLRSEVQGSR